MRRKKLQEKEKVNKKKEEKEVSYIYRLKIIYPKGPMCNVRGIIFKGDIQGNVFSVTCWVICKCDVVGYVFKCYVLGEYLSEVLSNIYSCDLLGIY